jgi:archaellum component FlaC
MKRSKQLPKKLEQVYAKLNRDAQHEAQRHEKVIDSLMERYEKLKNQKGFSPIISGIQAVRTSLEHEKISASDKESPASIRKQINALNKKINDLQKLCNEKHGHSWCHGITCVICDFTLLE